MPQPAEELLTEMSEAELGTQLHEALVQVSREGERIVVQLASGKAVAIVPLDVLQSIRAIEDERDAEAARAVLEEMQRTGEKAMPLEDYLKSIGETI